MLTCVKKIEQDLDWMTAKQFHIISQYFTKTISLSISKTIFCRFFLFESNELILGTYKVYTQKDLV